MEEMIEKKIKKGRWYQVSHSASCASRYHGRFGLVLGKRNTKSNPYTVIMDMPSKHTPLMLKSTDVVIEKYLL